MPGSNESCERQVTILNKEGFHSRPVMKFVELAQVFQAEIRVRSATGNGDQVDGKSAMELMLLGATAGTALLISATGSDAQEAVTALAELVNNKFNREA